MDSVLAVQQARAGKAARFSALAAMLFGAVAIAQAPPPLPAPDLPLLSTGEVRDIGRLPDGSMILAGEFEYVEGLPRRNLARMLNDGSFDPQWDPSPDGPVEAVAVGPDGSIYVVGRFKQIGGVARNGLARLASTGSGAADPAWSPSVGTPGAIAVDAVGRVYIGGFGTWVKRLLPDGSLDPDWPEIFSSPSVMALDATHLYIAGSLSTPTGFASALRISIASPAAIDPNWRATLTGGYSAMAVGDDGMVYLAGSISTPSGVRSVVRIPITGTGEPDPNWSVNTAFQLMTIAVRAGSVYLGGSFDTVNGQAARCLVRLSVSPPAVLDPTWVSGCNGSVRTIEIGADGSVAAGGRFTTMGGAVRLGVAHLDPLAQPLPSVRVQLPGVVESMTAHPDGGVLVSGRFQTGTPPRNHLLKLAGDGSIDAAWAPQVDREAFAMTVDGQGRSYLSRQPGGGSGLPEAMLLRLTSTGETDGDWSPQANGIVLSMATDAAGWIYLGGQFTEVNGVAVPYLARVDTDGKLDASWQPSPNAEVQHLLLDSLGRLYTLGLFTQMGGVERRGLARVFTTGTGATDLGWQSTAPQDVQHLSLALSNDGTHLLLGEMFRMRWLSTADGSWDQARDVDLDSGVRSIAVDQSGAIYLAGYFRFVDGVQRRSLAKLSAVGVRDPHWHPLPLPGNTHQVVVRSDGTVLVGGTFQSIGGQPRFALAALPAEVDRMFTNGFEPSPE